MLFNSIEFVVFFIITTSLFFVLPHKFRWVLLLIASSIFYMYFSPVYILILYFIIVMDYYAGLWMERLEGSKRKALFVSCVVIHVLILAFFKYFNFALENVNFLFNQSYPLLSIILPIGLSFHTFQALSYLIEVYRGNHPTEKHMGIYGVYILFYPQIVAGPIERPQNLIHQFYQKTEFNYDNVIIGLRLMLWGLIKKVVVADRLTLFSDPVFNAPDQYPATTLLMATVFFAFQIFCDFSGYTDIARGAAKVMGYELMLNFNYPYHSRSISEFWRRWHISLSTWFKDYVYKPLGGSRVNKQRAFLNLLVVFLLSGLWHGAAWTYVIWGLLNGVYLIAAGITKDYRERFNVLIGLSKFKRLDKLLDITLVFTLIGFSWIFFRANSLQDALLIINKIGTIPADIMQLAQTRDLAFLNLPGGLPRTMICILLIAFLEVSRAIDVKYDLLNNFKQLPTAFRWSTYFAGVMLIVLIGSFHNNSFIYFQF